MGWVKKGWILGLLGCLCSAAPLWAEVLDRAAHGFTVKIETRIAKPPAEVFRKLVEVSGWWESAHTFSGDARNLYLEPKANGCFCEKLSESAGVLHMTVVYVDPAKAMRWSGGLGPLQELGVSGSLSWILKENGDGTALTMTYGVGGYVSGGLDNWAVPVDGVLAIQVQRLKRFAETGKADLEKPAAP